MKWWHNGMVPDSDTVVDGSNPKIFEEMDIYLYWRMKRRIRHKSAIKIHRCIGIGIPNTISNIQVLRACRMQVLGLARFDSYNKD
ncbi:hypothetical protein OUZ56_022141 [Daphnia magna]|uniref:GMP synthase n=1 Tax=Daphnia magna TaxID=35525 RepID=A0ABR0AVF8_9CRUS|nr:hypothetical protein OUZ56_022141 [Daphnia magna]